jgi:hypothetical protein
MFYFPTISSHFKRNEYRTKVINRLEQIKDDVDSLVRWDKDFTDECNRSVIYDKDEYNKDYLELQRIINKIIGVK